MDIFELLSVQHRDMRRQFQEQRHGEIRALREQEEAAAAKRMEALQAIDAERRELLAKRLAEQRRQEKKLVTISVTAVALFVVTVIVYVVAAQIW